MLRIYPIIRTHHEWNDIIEKSPFTKKYDINHLHLTFLDDDPSSEFVDKLNQTDGSNDEYEIIGKEFYFVCDLKYSDTKFSNAFIEKTLNTKATTRNWKTVLAIQQLLSYLL